MTRKEANLEILSKLTDMVIKYPDLRFTQILSNLNLDKARFFEEPEKTLQRINKTISERGNL